LDRTTGPTPLLKQGHLQPVAQDNVHMAFEYLQGWRLHSVPGQPVPVLGCPHSEAVFPDVLREPSCVSVSAHCLWSCHWSQKILYIVLASTVTADGGGEFFKASVLFR